MASPLASKSVHATDIFDFVYGRFDLTGGWTIPYLSTVMTFRQAKESLQLVTEFSGWESLSWKLEELFQRDIDWPRVERKIVPYLSNHSQPRFFNSITVALIPKSGTTLVEHADLEKQLWHPPVIPDEEASGRKVTVGPIAVRYYHDWEEVGSPASKLGKVRWNKDETFCVAIDGQHRLAAIKEIAESGGEMSRADVPVLLILVDPVLGFRSPHATRNIDILRSLFIDLNKHAKRVSRMRLILLDDRDPTSLCTRATIGKALTDGFSEARQSTPLLPLTLVDWHTDGAKVDQGPYLISVLTLDWGVQKVLGTGPISDPMQFGSVRNQIGRLERALSLDLERAKERLAEAESAERPFAYSDSRPDELGDVEGAFREIWTPSVTWLFTRLAPYDRIINARESHGSDIADFTNWYQLWVGAEKDASGGHALTEYRRLVSRWAEQNRHYETVLKECLEEIEDKKRVPGEAGVSLAFTVVFQKALILAWLDFLKLDELTVLDAARRLGLSANDTEPRDDHEALALRNLRASMVFIELLNRVLASDDRLLSHYYERDGVALWLGTLLSADRSTIDFTEAAAIRGQDVILMPVYLQLLDSTLERISPEAVRAKIEESSDFSDPSTRLSRACRSFVNGVRTNAGDSTAVRILKARNVENPEDESACLELLDERLALFMSLL